MGLYNRIHYPCWVTATSIARDGSIGHVGGERNRLSSTPPPSSIASCSARLKGDANGDGRVLITDAQVTAQIAAGFSPYPFYSDSADADCNGAINIVDAMLIAQYTAGTILRLCP
jgi:hypothetical protein